MGGVGTYRTELRQLKEWDPYLKKHSGLPGPRANLELVQAVGEEAGRDRLLQLSESTDEFLALCGTAGLGHLAMSESATVMPRLQSLASDERWRVREGVAIALQHLGRQNMSSLVGTMEKWAAGQPYVQRAAVAGLCEPALLKDPREITRVLAILDRVTKSLSTSTARRDDGFRVLRQALGYCWSVAAAALPEKGRPAMEKWLQSDDPDVAWIMKSNLGKARMSALGATWLAKWRRVK
jgi:hypothetical protein